MLQLPLPLPPQPRVNKFDDIGQNRMDMSTTPTPPATPESVCGSTPRGPKNTLMNFLTVRNTPQPMPKMPNEIHTPKISNDNIRKYFKKKMPVQKYPPNPYQK